MSILNIILLIIGIYFIVSAFSENHEMSKGFVVFSGFYCIIYALLKSTSKDGGGNPVSPQSPLSWGRWFCCLVD